MADRIPRYLSVNGQLVAYGDANVHLLSPAVRFGVSVFEGIRGYWNEAKKELFLFRLNSHWERLQDSLKIMRLSAHPSVQNLTAELVDLIRANDLREDVHVLAYAYVEKEVGLGEGSQASIFMSAAPRGRFNGGLGLALGVSSWARISDRSMPPRVKSAANYHNSKLASLQAQADGYDSAVMLTQDGKVAEGPFYSIFIVRRGEVITPPVTDGILEGVTRESLIGLLPVKLDLRVTARSIDRTELYIADEVFVCGSGAEVTPVISVDRLPVGRGTAGPITTQVRELYFSTVRGEQPDEFDWLTPVYN